MQHPGRTGKIARRIVFTGLVSAVLALGSTAPTLSAAPSAQPVMGPLAQCEGGAEVTEWRGRFGRLNIDEHYNYYCGPRYAYSAEWYAAHVGAHPEWYTAYGEEPTTCTTYHFAYENRWYCYTGP